MLLVYNKFDFYKKKIMCKKYIMFINMLFNMIWNKIVNKMRYRRNCIEYKNLLYVFII